MSPTLFGGIQFLHTVNTAKAQEQDDAPNLNPHKPAMVTVAVRTEQGPQMHSVCGLVTFWH